MGRSKNKWPRWLAANPVEKFIPLVPSMQKSDAFRSLTVNQRDLLYLCWTLGDPRRRGKNARLPCNDFPGVDNFKHENVFYMCLKTAVADGIYAPTNKRYYEDMKALVQYGFIECLSKGKTGSMSVYKLASKWQQYKRK